MRTINKAIHFINRSLIFFELWGSYHYENRIDADLAWELAGIFNASDALDDFVELKP